MGEVGLLIESELIADLGNRLAGSQKQVLRLGELARLDDLRNALMDNVLTDEIEVANGHKQLIGIEPDATGFVVVLLQ